MPKSQGLLVKVRGDGAAFAANAKSLRAGRLDVEPILRVPAQEGGGNALAPDRGATWLKVRPRGGDSDNPWDEAHRLMPNANAFAAAGGPEILAVEPDIEQQWLHQMPPDATRFAAAGPVCAFDDQTSKGGQAIGPGNAWNFGVDFSQLAAARQQVDAKQSKVVIAHLDTGYDPAHSTLPANIQLALQKNFVAGFPPNDATDKAPAGSPVANRGHGAGTLSILAGNRLSGAPGWPGFSDFVGGAPGAKVIPVRIADWVVRLTTGTMVQGFNYATEQGAHVLSMSMGGLSSSALVDAVNLAYDKGMVMVTAGGNNIAFVPSPKSIVFPARYRRVLAACGVMADGRAYTGLSAGTMQGNYGPDSKMATALGAFTPNVPWAQIDCASFVDMDGAGTSAATPQVAAAAALWLAEHWDVVSQYPQPWMRVEAVRHALFTAASKSTAKMNAAETRQKIGQGVLKADDALAIAPLAASKLTKLPPAEESWSWVNLLFGGGVSFGPTGAAARQREAMLALELTQMAQRSPEVEAAIADPDLGAAAISPAARNRYLEAALDHGNPSQPLRAVLEGLLARAGAVTPVKKPTTATPVVKRKVRQPAPPSRRLRVYALDPSIGKRLDSVSVHATTLSVPWDDQPLTAEPLRPGPIGEYLEVIDVDPASDRVYDPVDLNDRMLLAQDGWTPSEGNPQFHQQMVYAVAMTTIGHFERALGRRALWAPRYAEVRGKNGEMRFTGAEVPRLRIYPHALRTDNAYYSPDKKALLFGYFPADSAHGDVTTPGSTVFTCLSSDIIAHEMSHALLDGLHRRLQEASNPDVPAFHEAFADIVALFQHFTMRDLVEHEIAKTRGNLSAMGLLSGLARQFGEGSGRAGPLRDYAEPAMAELDYDTTMRPHERGSILVIAVYEAFQKIVGRRTEELIRLATGGSGVLPLGALHPELVTKLAAETSRAAAQVLTMCIRALDYCPAVDITFSEYLRAIITADLDAFPEDELHYRLAFMESFQNWKLLPRDIRTTSEETIAWNMPVDPSPPWLSGLLADIDLSWALDLDRSAIFKLNEKNRWKVWNGLRAAFKADPSLLAEFGLLPDVPRFDRHGKVAKPARKGETTFDVFSVRPTRRVAPDGSFRTEIVAVVHQRQAMPVDPENRDGGWFWFRGGATVIIDPRKGREEIRYSIIKNSGSAARQERQRRTAATGGSLRSLYFGAASEPFALLHQDHDHD